MNHVYLIMGEWCGWWGWGVGVGGGGGDGGVSDGGWVVGVGV